MHVHTDVEMKEIKLWSVFIRTISCFRPRLWTYLRLCSRLPAAAAIPANKAVTKVEI